MHKAAKIPRNIGYTFKIADKEYSYEVYDGAIAGYNNCRQLQQEIGSSLIDSDDDRQNAFLALGLYTENYYGDENGIVNYAYRGIADSIFRERRSQGFSGFAYRISRVIALRGLDVNNIYTIDPLELKENFPDEEFEAELPDYAQEYINEIPTHMEPKHNYLYQGHQLAETNFEDELVEFLTRENSVKDLLNNLTSSEREIIELRYGFKDGNCYTYEEASRLTEQPISRNYAKMIETKAIIKLRTLLNAKVRLENNQDIMNRQSLIFQTYLKKYKEISKYIDDSIFDSSKLQTSKELFDRLAKLESKNITSKVNKSEIKDNRGVIKSREILRSAQICIEICSGDLSIYPADEIRIINQFIDNFLNFPRQLRSTDSDSVERLNLSRIEPRFKRLLYKKFEAIF